MQYLGGKTRLAKDIARIISVNRGSRKKYIEPFLGGGSVFELVAPAFDKPMAGDACEDLMLMWQAAVGGWVPPDNVSEADYATAKNEKQPSPTRAFIGFGCSFGAKWFGGYARNRAGTNYASQGSRSVIRKAQAMRLATLRHAPYWDWDTDVDADTVIYADPPYAGTEPYSATGRFDHGRFWQTMDDWQSRGALVLVSEYTAPGAWQVLWDRQHRQQLAGGNARPVTTERIYWRGQ